jgi:hypothetical protein
MTLRRKWIAALVACVVVTAGIALHRGQPRAHSYRFDWAADTRYVYRLDWSTRDRVKLPVGDTLAESELELGGELRLRGYGSRDGAQLVGLSIAADRAHAAALGHDLLSAGDGTLEGREALLQISSRGEVGEIFFQPSDPETWKSLVQALAAELHVSLPPAPAVEWQAQADDGLGAAELSYRAVSPDELARRRVAYRSLRALPDHKAFAAAKQAIASRHTLRLDGGHLRALDEEDTISVAPAIEHHAKLALALIRVETVAHAGADVAALEPRRAGQPVTNELARRQLLAQRTAGMSGAELMNAIYTHTGGGLHDDAAWFWKATGVLIEHPEVCAELRQAFSDGEMSAETRRVILDLLAGAGHAEAQAALRGALVSAEATSSKEYPLWVQRLSLVPDPTAETARFLVDARARARTAESRDLERATGWSLGAVVGNLAKRDPGAAAQLNQALVGELKSARNADEKRDALRALGNAGLDENVSLVMGERKAEDPSVRAAAAAALRKTATPETTLALIDLAGDDAQMVSAEALSSLRGRDLDGTQGDGLVALAPRLADVNQPELANLLIEHLGEGDWAFRALKQLADHTHDPRLSARIRALFAPGT